MSDKKVESIGTDGSYTPTVILSNLLEDVDEIEFIAVVVNYKDGLYKAGWSAHDEALAKTAFGSDVMKAELMKTAVGDT